MYELLKLPYEYSALEPAIDRKTMEVHYTKHYQGYLDNLKKTEGFEETIPIETLLVTNDRPGIQNQGGGYYNHGLFWMMMSPEGGGKPEGELWEAMIKKFASFEKFQEEFKTKALTLFGSGWVWLVKDKRTGELKIIQKINQNHPDLQEQIPILGLDVWEHAYYLHYQNRRVDYVDAWWDVVNWDYCCKRYLF